MVTFSKKLPRLYGAVSKKNKKEKKVVYLEVASNLSFTFFQFTVFQNALR